MKNYLKLQEALQDVEKEIFKANAYKSCLENEIREIIIDKALSRFSKRIVYKNNLRYVLHDIRSHLYGCRDFYDLPNAVIKFVYVLESPNKKQSEKLNTFKIEYKQSKYVPFDKSRIPLYFEVNQDVTLESALLGNYNIAHTY